MKLNWRTTLLGALAGIAAFVGVAKPEWKPVLDNVFSVLVMLGLFSAADAAAIRGVK